MTINSPTISMKAVIIRIHSLLRLPADNAIALMYPSFDRRLSQRGGRHGAPHHSRERDDRQRVRYHLHVLRRDGLRSLQLDLQRLRGGEQQARETSARRIPPAKDRRGER